jgi:hypothetical protein
VGEGSTTVSYAAGPSVPDSVFADVEGNPGLIRKWVTEPDFRAGLLNADDPAVFAAQYGITLHAETSTWIKARVAARGVDALVNPSPNPIPF